MSQMADGECALAFQLARRLPNRAMFACHGHNDPAESMLAKMQAPPLSNIAEYTVTELSSAIKRTVEDAYGLVRLRGEISGYRGPHSSGHVYLSLKDERARIDGVIWRGVFSNLKFKPEEGLEVIVTGRITTFPGKSSYQIVIEQLEPAGAGALMALLEERKKRFAAEGLFDEARKKPLPFWPQVVGIVTSPTGAVIRDMLHGFTERCPTHAVVWPVRVQGETCAAEVAAAIRGFNAADALSPFPKPGRAHCGARRRQPRRPLGLQRGGGCARGCGKRDSAYFSGWARNRLDVDRLRCGCPRTDADQSGGMGGADAFRPYLTAFRVHRPREAQHPPAARRAPR